MVFRSSLIIFLILCSVDIFAYDWQKDGITVSATENSKVQELRDSSGNVFFIENESLVSDSSARKIIDIKNIFFKWKNIGIDRIKFLVKPDEIEISVIPSSFSYEKTDVMNNIKAGFLFSYSDEALRYNFRILTKNVFVRVSGVYLDENLFCKKIVEAVKDPQTFIQRRDADYFLARLEKLDSRVELLESELNVANKRLNYALMAFQNDRFFAGQKPVSDEVVSEVVSLRSENPKINKNDIKKKLKEKKIKFTDKELDIILAVYFGEM